MSDEERNGFLNKKIARDINKIFPYSLIGNYLNINKIITFDIREIKEITKYKERRERKKEKEKEKEKKKDCLLAPPNNNNNNNNILKDNKEKNINQEEKEMKKEEEEEEEEEIFNYIIKFVCNYALIINFNDINNEKEGEGEEEKEKNSLIEIIQQLYYKSTNTSLNINEEMNNNEIESYFSNFNSFNLFYFILKQEVYDQVTFFFSFLSSYVFFF